MHGGPLLATFPGMQLLAQAGRVLLVGIVLGVGVGVLRGFPELPARADEEVCLPPDATEPAITWVGAEPAADLHGQPGVVFVDARSRDEFVTGHVSGALSVPMEHGTVPDAIVEMLAGSRTVIAYDDTEGECARSTRLASLLVAAGIGDVRVLEGGMPGWLAAGHAAEAGTCQLCP